jgi:hypothetical protein
MARHAFGEVVAVVGAKNIGPSWAETEIEVALSEEGDPEIRRGVFSAASRIWNEPAWRAEATRILTRACVLASTQEDYNEIMRIFDVSDQLVSDVHLKELFETMLRFPAILSGRSIRLPERLEDLLPEYPEMVCDLASAYVNQRTRPGAVTGDLFSSGPKLVDISLTLQRFDGGIRTKGLDLFEQLLEAEAYGTSNVLAEVDAGRQTSSDVLTQLSLAC